MFGMGLMPRTDGSEVAVNGWTTIMSYGTDCSSSTFTATSDPSVLGIKPIPNIEKVISDMIEKYRVESLDIDDIEYEEADIIYDDYEEVREDETDNP